MTLVQLNPYEELSDRPFTHLRHTVLDLQVIRFMASCGWLALEERRRTAGDAAGLSLPLAIHLPDESGWVHRLIITQPERLLEQKPLTVVGFFGLKSAGANVALAQALDRQLIPELMSHRELLAYISTCLPTGNFANLVLFASAEGKEEWGKSQKHASAVGLLTPDYYEAVRLYNGELTGGLVDLESLALHLVKYYDYRSRPLWRAARPLRIRSTS